MASCNREEKCRSSLERALLCPTLFSALNMYKAGNTKTSPSDLPDYTISQHIKQ